MYWRVALAEIVKCLRHHQGTKDCRKADNTIQSAFKVKRINFFKNSESTAAGESIQMLPT